MPSRLADTYSGMEDFQGVGMQLDQQIDNLGKGLAQGQQQMRADRTNKP